MMAGGAHGSVRHQQRRPVSVFGADVPDCFPCSETCCHFRLRYGNHLDDDACQFAKDSSQQIERPFYPPQESFLSVHLKTDGERQHFGDSCINPLHIISFLLVMESDAKRKRLDESPAFLCFNFKHLPAMPPQKAGPSQKKLRRPKNIPAVFLAAHSAQACVIF
jgi:hypothetical protein